MIFRLAGRNVFYQFHRYRLVTMALAFGFCVMLCIAAVSAGMLDNARDKAVVYFGGYADITSFSRGQTHNRVDVARILQSAQGLGDIGVTVRTAYYRADAQIFFAGNGARQRRIIGVDWNTESQVFAGLGFVSGGFPNLAANSLGVAISERTARELGARVGDDLTLLISTTKKQKNTINLILEGIYRDDSIFGFTAYMSRTMLNRAMNVPDDFATDIALYTSEPEAVERMLPGLARELASDGRSLDIVRKSSGLDSFFHEDWRGSRMVIQTLDSQLGQVRDLFSAVSFVTWFLLLVFVLVVIVGVSNTFRLLTDERTVEIGVMRAMGMQKKEVLGTFLAEAFVLLIIGLAAGTALSIFILRLLGLVNFGNSGAFSLFLDDGYLHGVINPRVYAIGAIALALAVGFASFFPARRASDIQPVNALREEH